MKTKLICIFVVVCISLGAGAERHYSWPGWLYGSLLQDNFFSMVQRRASSKYLLITKPTSEYRGVWLLINSVSGELTAIHGTYAGLNNIIEIGVIPLSPDYAERYKRLRSEAVDQFLAENLRLSEFVGNPHRYVTLTSGLNTVTQILAPDNPNTVIIDEFFAAVGQAKGATSNETPAPAESEPSQRGQVEKR